ncbi:MAG: transcription antitermination factor NusB [Pyrinomonadaceae bacterium]
MAISPSRTAAFKALKKIETGGENSSVVLANIDAEMDDRDRRLVYSIVLGSLRNQIQLDHAIDRLSSKKAAKLDTEVRIILRLSLFQLIFLERVPEYSVVNDAVAMVRKARKSSASGFVNAILRRHVREAGDRKDTPKNRTHSNLFPAFLSDRWETEFGREKAEQIKSAFQDEPVPAFRFTAKFKALEPSEQSEIVETAIALGARKGDLSENAWRIKSLDAEMRALFEMGLIYFQDEASMLVGETVARLAGDGTVLDLCAAPGSKTGIIAGRDGSGGKTIACDVSATRLETTRALLMKQGVAVDLIRLDAEIGIPLVAEFADVVLVDAPCSGTGTIGSNPEIRFRISEDELSKHKTKQLQLLAQASKVVKSGGWLVYSTCSLEKDENETVVSSFLVEFKDFCLETPAWLEQLSSMGIGKRILPYEFGTEGFYIACMKRTDAGV